MIPFQRSHFDRASSRSQLNFLQNTMLPSFSSRRNICLYSHPLHGFISSAPTLFLCLYCRGFLSSMTTFPHKFSLYYFDWFFNCTWEFNGMKVENPKRIISGGPPTTRTRTWYSNTWYLWGISPLSFSCEIPKDDAGSALPFLIHMKDIRFSRVSPYNHTLRRRDSIDLEII